MARRKPPGDGPALMYPAITAYKEWVRAELGRRDWSMQQLADRMKRHGAPATTTSAVISQILGREGEKPKPSNTSLLPAMNKALGLAPPPVCDPADPHAKLRDTILEKLAQLSPRDRSMIMTILDVDPET